MASSFQLTQRLQAAAVLCLTTGIMKAKLFTYPGGQRAAVKASVAL
jgi:hypothetical protein